jgi:hypothetical protein
MELPNCRSSVLPARRDNVGLDFVHSSLVVPILGENELDVSVVIVSWNTRDILKVFFIAQAGLMMKPTSSIRKRPTGAIAFRKQDGDACSRRAPASAFVIR